MSNNSLKKVATGGLLFGVGSLAASLLQFVFGVMVIRYMPAEHFGVISLANTLITILVTFSVLGFQSGLPRFISMHKNSGERQAVPLLAGSAIIVAAGLSLGLSIVLFLARHQLGMLFSMPLLPEVLKYFVLLTFPLALMIIFNTLFRGVGDAKAKVIYQDVSLNFIKLVILALAIAVISYRLDIVLAVYVLSTYLTFIIYSAYTTRKFVAIYKLGFEIATAKQLVLFSIPLLGVALSTNIINWAGVLSLGYFGEAHEVAYFSAAQRAGQILTIPLVAIGFLFLPVATGLISSNKNDEVAILYTGVTKWITVLTVPVVLYLLVDAEYFLGMLFGSEYSQVGDVLRLLIIASFVHVMMGPNSMAIVAHGNTRIVFVAAMIASAVSVIGSVLLVPVLGVIGAAYAISSAQVISNMYISWNMYRLYRIHIFDKTLVKPVVLSIFINMIVIFIAGVYKPIGDLTYILILPLMFIISLFAPYISRCVSEEDYELLNGIRARLLR